MTNVNRVEPYSALSEVYQAAGFAEYSAQLAPRLLNLAFNLEWIGRSLLDLACGTGDACLWFAGRSFRVTGVDSSAAMLDVGTATATDRGFNVDFRQGDMRAFDSGNHYEMITCLGGSLNYVPALRDLEQVFRQAHAALMPGKLFIFDVYTIQGLARRHDSDRVVFDKGDIYIVTREAFNYESLLLTRHFTILRCVDNATWQRAEELHTLRGYPVQAILSLLGKVGFKVLRTLTPDLEPADQLHNVDQLLFVTTRD
jgi:SAM-dependent methyltransferase